MCPGTVSMCLSPLFLSLSLSIFIYVYLSIDISLKKVFLYAVLHVRLRRRVVVIGCVRGRQCKGVVCRAVPGRPSFHSKCYTRRRSIGLHSSAIQRTTLREAFLFFLLLLLVLLSMSALHRLSHLLLSLAVISLFLLLLISLSSFNLLVFFSSFCSSLCRVCRRR